MRGVGVDALLFVVAIVVAVAVVIATNVSTEHTPVLTLALRRQPGLRCCRNEHTTFAIPARISNKGHKSGAGKPQHGLYDSAMQSNKCFINYFCASKTDPSLEKSTAIP